MLRPRNRRRDPSHAPTPASALRRRRPAWGPATTQKAVRRGRGCAAWRQVVARPRRGSAIAALMRGEGVPRWGTPVPGGPRPAPASAGRKAVRAPALRRLRRRTALGLLRAHVSRGLPAPPASAPASPPPPLPASLASVRARGSAPCQRVPPQGVRWTCCRRSCVRPPSPGLRGPPFGERCRGRSAARVSSTPLRRYIPSPQPIDATTEAAASRQMSISAGGSRQRFPTLFAYLVPVCCIESVLNVKRFNHND